MLMMLSSDAEPQANSSAGIVATATRLYRLPARVPMEMRTSARPIPGARPPARDTRNPISAFPSPAPQIPSRTV